MRQRRAPERYMLPSVFRFEEAIKFGFTPAQIRGPQFERIGVGVFRRRDIEIRPFDAYAAYSKGTPDSHLSHSSAALAWGLWLPSRYRHGLPVHISRTGTSGKRVRQTNVIGHWSSATEADVRTVSGIRLASPAWTWTQLAGLGLSFEDLVAAGDSLLQDPAGPPRPKYAIGSNPLSSLAEIASVLERRRSFHGRQLAVKALPLLREKVDSRPESIVRQRIGRRGYPELEVNPILVLAGGQRIRPDLADRAHRIVVQYEGKHHGEEAQIGRDIRRDFSFERVDWISVRVDKSFFTPRGEAEFFERLSAAYERRGVLVGRR